MSSSDQWSSGSKRRRGDRGVVHRLPEDRLQGSPRAELPGSVGLGVLVLQVEGSSHRPRGSSDAASSTPAVKQSFEASERTYGSPRVYEDLVDDGWTVSKRTVEHSMAAQGLCGRPKRKSHNLTSPDKAAEPVPDLVNRRFTAPEINAKWCGDLTEIPTDEGKLYLAACSTSDPGACRGSRSPSTTTPKLATAAIQMATAVRGGNVKGVMFHSDKGSEFTADLFAAACRRLGITRSMGRVGSCFDNAAAESLNSTLEFELLSRQRFATRADARRAVARSSTATTQPDGTAPVRCAHRSTTRHSSHSARLRPSKSMLLA